MRLKRSVDREPSLNDASGWKEQPANARGVATGAQDGRACSMFSQSGNKRPERASDIPVASLHTAKPRHKRKQPVAP